MGGRRHGGARPAREARPRRRASLRRFCSCSCPLIAVVAAAIRLDSRGPAFFRCRRVGYGGREFGMLKFRKMVDGAAGGALTAPRGRPLHAARPRPRQDEARRDPAALERAEGRDEPGRATAGGRRLRRALRGRVPSRSCAYARGSPASRSSRSPARARSSIPTTGTATTSRSCCRPRRGSTASTSSRRSLAMDLKILFWTAAAVLLRLEVAVHRQSGRLTRRRPRVALESQPARGVVTSS